MIFQKQQRLTGGKNYISIFSFVVIRKKAVTMLRSEWRNKYLREESEEARLLHKSKDMFVFFFLLKKAREEY